MKLFTILRFTSLALATLALTAIYVCAQNKVPASSGGTLLSFDFAAKTWPRTTAEAVGTIDVAGSTLRSRGVRSSALISSGPLGIQNSETNLGKLTLSFSLSASAARPVTVRVESFDTKRKRSGGLETTIYPAAPDFYQRYALELSTFKPSGNGRFAANAPFIGFTFSVGGASWQGIPKPEIRLDNVQFAKPTWYVSASGKDQSDGHNENTAFATPQRAVDMARPGDIILVMKGTYLPNGAQEGIVRFRKAGTPAGWITLKNYPGHKPLFSIAGTWTGIRVLRTAAEATDEIADPVPSYLEVRGLHIVGEGDVARTKYPDKIGQAAPETNGNAISVQWDAKPGEIIPHHLRFADNLIEYCPGAGIGPGASDWVTVENNVIRNNCWTTIYATSGISMNHGSNFDGTVGAYRILIRDNVTSGNRTFEKWKQINKVSDGNGIIIDVNQDSKLPEEQRFSGRTLIQNNLSFNNGGSGIHAFKSKRVDIINNTVYMNSASPELPWGQLFVQQSEDVRMINNIVVAPPDQPVNTVGANGNDQNSKAIVRANNLYFGGGSPPIMGDGDTIADPQFVNPSIDEKVADFRLKPNSPAMGRGRSEAFTPIRDIAGKLRAAAPTVGAYEREGAAASMLAANPAKPMLSPLPGATSTLGTTLPSAPAAAPALAPAGSGTLLQLDFNGPNPWPQAAADVLPSTPIDVATSIEAKAVGTIDVAGSTTPSGAMLLKTVVGEVGLPWIATYSSGLMPVRNGETNLGKLTMAFNLSASAARPVVVRVESFGANKLRSGGLETTIYPAAPDFHQRYALDLSAMSAHGAGKFNPVDPHIQLTFELKNPAWPDKASHELRVDNVHYARPTYYISANGSDTNDGRSEATAFANPQKAIDMAAPGDIILVMNGTYKPVDVQGGIAAFKRGGTPSAWISLKNYPGHKPLFFVTNSWAGVRIGRPAAQKAVGTQVLPTLCYIEVRGLHLRGEADVAKEKYSQWMDKADPRTNSNGILVDGGNESNTPHHLRFADNIVEFCPGAGIGVLNADWITTENNIVRNNCWWMIYAGSGISYLGTANFDAAENIYKDLIRNNAVSGNRCFLKWKQIGKVSDGNGIIIDSSHVPAQNKSHQGRTLIQSNLVFNNGGSGIHAFKAHRIDIINNTAYMNGASPELKWGQIFLQRTDDARVINNILWARDGQPVNTVGLNSTDKENTNVVRAHNLYFGGVKPTIMGEGDIIADPQFVNPSVDDAVADFRLKPGSAALKTGRVEAFSPLLDLDGKPRPLDAAPDKGAFQK